MESLETFYPRHLPIDQFDIERVGDEYVLLNQVALTYHTMNQSAFDIWTVADGTRNLAGIQQALRSNYPELPLELIEHGISEMITAGLLVETDRANALLSSSRRFSRRTIMATGIGIALPVIVSITAPEAGAQSSGLPLGAACNCSNGTTCCASGCCLELYAFPCNGVAGCMESVFANYSQVCIVKGTTLCVPGFPSVCVPTPWGAQCK